MAVAGSPRLIFVDDEPDILYTIRTGLSRLFNFRVDTFASPSTALSTFEARKYDFALLDIHMPEMDGFALARQLLKIDHNLTICFLSGVRNIEESFAREFPELSADHLLGKPVGLNDLSIAIHKLLRL